MASVYLTADLLFSSRVQSAAKSAGVELAVVASPADLGEAAVAQGVRQVILDLTAPGLDLATLVSQIRQAAPGARLVAYAPHVMKPRLAAARDAGCDLVLTRGQFDARRDELLQY
jgi:CheY-like chemotaxis protein